MNSQSPEQLLQAVNREEYEKNRGHLKIFFGYAAGVGKTYAMLQAAQGAKQRGIDVAAGYVEPHARPHTLELLEGLEQIPNLILNHKGITVREFDLDAAIRRKTQLVLVDELAHSNAPGCRHRKRYQDVEELLKAGIDVYSTVNVQHIESLNDIVCAITGVNVRERIPDSVFDNASWVELVDIEPQELLERLQSGDVYREAQAKRAVKNFFTLDKLIALRELALRRCADRVNLLSENARIKSGGEYHTEEHILVCLSSAPSNLKIIRTAARMAKAFHGSFTALYVETADFALMEEEDRRRLHSNMRLAQQLGAKIETVYGEDIPLQIAEFARLAGVSKIVIGRNRTIGRFFFGRSILTDTLISQVPNIDIYIIPDSMSEGGCQRKKTKRKVDFSFHTRDAAVSVLGILLASVIGLGFYHLGLSEANIIMVYLLGVLVTSVITTRQVYSLISSLVSVVLFDFLFIEPRFTLQTYEKDYPITFAIMFAVAFLTGSLAVRLKKQTMQAAQVAYRTQLLFDTNQLLERVKDREEIITVTATHLRKLLGRDVIIYPAEKGELLPPKYFSTKEEGICEEYLSENERAVAHWVLKNNKHAGATTDTLASAGCLYLSIRTGEGIYGVIGIVIGDHPLDSFENSILLSILGECALALENRKNRDGCQEW